MNSGTEVSAPANPNRCRNTSADRPSAAPKDSTTVPISTSGATIARSSRPRMIITTPSTSGMITFRSWVASLSDVHGHRGAAADLGVGARDRVHGGPHPVDLA